MTARPNTFLVKYRQTLIMTGVFAVLVILFLAAPWTGDDWTLFHGAAKALLDGDPLFVDQNHYYNPPWLAMALTPLAVLPVHFGWAVIAAATIFVVPAILIHWEAQPGLIKVLLGLLSPPTVYIFLHGQIDAVMVALVLLPAEWWAVVAVTKPQVTLGLLAGIPPSKWLKAGLILAGFVLVTFVLIGFWVPDMLALSRDELNTTGRNLWVGLWPFQVPVGVGLIAAGWSRKDERLLIAGSPFLSPYAAMSSLVGPWLAALTYLRTWQAALVWLSWWGAVVYRGLA